MKFTRRSWLTWLAIALAAGWIAWSMRLERKPIISFLEFREVNGMRMAVFATVNHSDSMLMYHTSPCTQGPDIVYRRPSPDGWQEIPYPEMRPSVWPHIWDFISPGDRVEFSVPLVSVNGDPIKKPFQVMVRFVQVTPRYIDIIDQLAGHNRPQSFVDSFSETVTP